MLIVFAMNLEIVIPFLFVGGAIAILITFVVLSLLSSRRRRQACEELAQHLGFEFTPEATSNSMAHYRVFHLFKRGRSQKIFNMLRGSSNGTDVLIFDWQFVTGSGKSRHTHNTTVIAFESADLNLPKFLCRPETVFDWFGLTFDGKDIDFGDHPAFSKKYHLHSDNEHDIRHLFDGDVCDFLVQKGVRTIEGHQQKLVYFESGRSLPVDKIEDRFREAYEFFALMKSASQNPQ